MSVATVSALTTSVGELSGTIEGIGISIGALSVPPAAIAAATVAAAVSLGKLFGQIWNSQRQNIPGVLASLQNAIGKSTTLGKEIQATLTRWNNVTESQITPKIELIKQIDGVNIDINEAIIKLNKISDNLFQQVVSWTQDLALIYIAGNDNTFYTQNKDNIDALINVYSSSGTHITSLEDTIRKAIQSIQHLIDLVEAQYEVSVYRSIAIALPTQSKVPGLTDTIPTEEDINRLLRMGVISERLAQILRDLVNSLTRARTKTRRGGSGKKRKKWKKKVRKQKKKKERQPAKIRMAYVHTYDVSEWIAKVTFIFPTLKDLESDDKGTIIFTLKDGGEIRFVRVKRGTFSVIALTYGTGYRLWSQFWKKKLVKRPPHPQPVLSWFIKRINEQDREIAIPQEIKNKKVKYK